MTLRFSQLSPSLRAFVIGSPGCAAVVVFVPPPEGVPALALIVNPLILLSLAALAGAAFASRLGMRSTALLDHPLPGKQLVWWMGAGILTGTTLGLVDQFSAALWRPADSAVQTLSEAGGISALTLGLFYGAITEEIIMRWGLLCAFAIGLLRLMPREKALCGATWLTAAIFALGHLPTLFLLEGDPGLGVMIRTGGLNMIAGLLFGYAFIRTSLEAAMASHMGFHIGAFGLALSTSLIS